MGCHIVWYTGTNNLEEMPTPASSHTLQMEAEPSCVKHLYVSTKLQAATFRDAAVTIVTVMGTLN